MIIVVFAYLKNDNGIYNNLTLVLPFRGTRNHITSVVCGKTSWNYVTGNTHRQRDKESCVIVIPRHEESHHERCLW